MRVPCEDLATALALPQLAQEPFRTARQERLAALLAPLLQSSPPNRDWYLWHDAPQGDQGGRFGPGVAAGDCVLLLLGNEGCLLWQPFALCFRAPGPALGDHPAWGWQTGKFGPLVDLVPAKTFLARVRRLMSISSPSWPVMAGSALSLAGHRVSSRICTEWSTKCGNGVLRWTRWCQTPIQGVAMPAFACALGASLPFWRAHAPRRVRLSRS